jgi:hypothetical protein
MSMIFPSRITIRLSALVMAVFAASYVDAQDIRDKPARSTFIAATMLLADFNEDEQQRLNPQQLRPYANEYEHQQHQQQEAQQPPAGQPPSAATDAGGGDVDPAASWRATPRLPPNRNPLLGRWRLVSIDNGTTTGTAQVSAFSGLLGPQYTAMAQNMANSMYGATCSNLFANGGVVEFRPADFVAIEDGGATHVIARDEYHADGSGVVMLPNDPMMAKVLEFDVHGDQARARRLGCVLQRVSLSKHPTPAPTAGVAPQAAASGDAGLATLSLLIHVQPPGAGTSAPFAPASGAAVMLETRSVDEALAAAGFTSPNSRAAWANACAVRDEQACKRGLQAMMANPVAKGVANDKGQLAIPGIPPGRYYVFSAADAGGRNYMWDVPMTLKSGSNVRFLDQSTALQPPE